MRHASRSIITTLVAAVALGVAAPATYAGTAPIGTEPTVTKVAAPAVQTVGQGFRLTTGLAINCPAEAGAAGCSARGRVTAVIGASASARLATVGTISTSGHAAASTFTTTVALSRAGAAELRRVGALRLRLSMVVKNEGEGAGVNVLRAMTLTIPDFTTDAPKPTTRLAPGQRLVLTVPENQTTAYRSELTPLPAAAGLRLVSSRYVVDEDCGSPARPGCGGDRVFTFATRRTGTTQILVKRVAGDGSEGSVLARTRVSTTARGAATRVVTTPTGRRTVTLGRGQQLAVNLDTPWGYHVVPPVWEVSGPSARTALRLVGIAAATADGCGYPATECGVSLEFAFVARRPGTTVLTFRVEGAVQGSIPPAPAPVTLTVITR